MTNLKTTVAAIAAAALISTSLAGAAYATGGGHDPITICHKGKTITVDDDAWKAHQKHGDTKGACSPEPTEEPTEEPTTEPTEEPTSEPTEEPTSEPTEKPTSEPSPSASESSEPKPNKTATRPQRGTSKKPSGHAGSSRKSAQQNVTVDRNADGVEDVYGPGVVEEGF